MKKTSGIPNLFTWVSFFCVLGGAQAASDAGSHAPGVIQLEKISYDFLDIVRVELRGVVVESADNAHKGSSIPFVQTLYFFKNVSNPIQKSFSEVSELRAWAENEPCKEFQQVTLSPLHETSSQGISPMLTRLRPQSVTLVGTRIDSKVMDPKVSPISETVYCK